MGVAFMDAAVYYDMAVGHSRDYRHLMAHKHYGMVLGKILHHGVDLPLKGLVDITEGFVKHNYFRIRYECTRQKCSLKLSS